MRWLVVIALWSHAAIAGAPASPEGKASRPATKPWEHLYAEAGAAVADNKLPLAELKLKRVLVLAPNELRAYRMLANVYRRMNKPALEIRALKRYLVLAPGAADAESMKARLAELQKKPAKA